MAGESSPTITAAALVERAAAAYLGFETKVSSPGPACSIPFTPVISESGEPFSRRTFRAEAIAESFMVIDRGTTESYTTHEQRLLERASSSRLSPKLFYRVRR